MTKNEAARIAGALASVPAGARLLVLDAESTDGTADVARRSGATVVVRPWTDFVDARRYAASLVETPWTFMLDADECMDRTLRDAVIECVPSDGTTGYRVARSTYLCGRAIGGAGWGGERLLRLFRTRRAEVVAQPAAGGGAALHERWMTSGHVEDLPGTLLHDSYPTLAAYRAKFARYTALEAAGQRGALVSLVRAVARVPLAFAWLYVARGAWRDGWRGAFVAGGSALYPAAVAWKALRRRRVP